MIAATEYTILTILSAPLSAPFAPMIPETIPIAKLISKLSRNVYICLPFKPLSVMTCTA